MLCRSLTQTQYPKEILYYNYSVTYEQNNQPACKAIDGVSIKEAQETTKHKKIIKYTEYNHNTIGDC